MNNYGTKQRTNQSVTIPNKQRIAAWLVCASIGATALTSSAALQFNGIDSGAGVNGHYLDGLEHAQFTIDIWAKPATMKSATLVVKGESWKEWWLNLSPDGSIGFGGAWPNFYYQGKSQTNAYTTNVWQHICVTVSNGLATFYCQGQSVGTAANIHNPVSFASQGGGTKIAPMCLGFADSGTTPDYDFYHGLLANLRVWSRSLTPAEVLALASTGTPANTNGLGNFLPLDENTGTTFSDRLTSVSGFIYGSATWSSDSPQPPCSPHKATATATLVNGFVVGATITDSGCGYTNAPTVLIQSGGGSGATATAVVSGGQVTAINITIAGCCYTNAPKIVIGSPPFVPSVSIGVSKVKVTQNVVLGRNYVLESSTNLVNWTATGPQFTAESETIVSEFDADVTGRFFQIREVP